MNRGQSLVSPKRVTLILARVVLFLFIAGIVSNFVRDFQCHRGTLNSGPLVNLFALNKEANIPTFFSVSTLLLCSALLAIIALAKKKEDARFVLHWAAMSFIFIYLSFDEAFVVHEKWSKPLRTYFNAGGFFYFAWVIPAIAFVLILVLAYLRFLTDLPQKTRNLFLVAGALFVGGALGMELISGYYNSFYLGQIMTLSRFCDYYVNFSMIVTVEELLEMLGIVVFIYALMSYISLNVKVELTLIK